VREIAYAGTSAVQPFARQALTNPVAAVSSPATAATSAVMAPIMVAALLPPPDDGFASAAAGGESGTGGACTVTVTADCGGGAVTVIGVAGPPFVVGGPIVICEGAVVSVAFKLGATIVISRSAASVVRGPDVLPLSLSDWPAKMTKNKITPNAAKVSPTAIHMGPRPWSVGLVPSTMHQA
jgi:hypothetical protein